MLLFGFLVCTFWWAIIAFNMCFEVRILSTPNYSNTLYQIFIGSWLQIKEGWWKWARIAVYNLVGWGIPFLLMVIPASAGKLGFEPGSTL